MRYHYFYQNKKNESCEGWINARDRNDVYVQLKKDGIKPFKVVGRNPYAWKRWTAIGALIVIVCALSAALVRYKIAANQKAFASEDRSQIYGDPVLMRELSQNGWRGTMGNECDAWFARHARPGILCDCTATNSPISLNSTLIKITDSDIPEIAKMKRLINGMKREYQAYIEAGGTEPDYKKLCDERLLTEHKIKENIQRELNALSSKLTDKNYDSTLTLWEKKNTLLRSYGLPTLAPPDRDEE